MDNTFTRKTLKLKTTHLKQVKMPDQIVRS